MLRLIPDFKQKFKLSLFAILTLMACVSVACHSENSRGDIAPIVEPVLVAINTELGQIQVELDLVGTPIPANNFLNYVDAGLYNKISFYRAIKNNSLIGGGVADQAMREGNYESMLSRVFPPVKLQAPTAKDKPLERGAIAYAHLGKGMFIQSEFILMVATEASLRYRQEENGKLVGLRPFGRVIKGMDIVDNIYQMETGGTANLPWGQGSILKRYVSISSVERL